MHNDFQIRNDLQRMKDMQLNNMITVLSVISFFNVAFLFFRSPNLRSNWELWVHSFFYFLLLCSFLPPIHRNYNLKRIFPLPILTLSGIILIITVGSAGIGYLVSLLAILYVLYFFSRRQSLVFTLSMFTVIISIVCVRLSGNYAFQVVNPDNFDWIILVSKPTFMILIVILMYYFFDNYNSKLKDLLIQKQVNSETNRITEDIINSTPGLFCMYDENWDLVKWNKNHELITGFTQDDLYHKNALEWFEPEDQQDIRQVLSLVLTGKDMSVEKELIFKDGSKHPYLINVKRIDVNGKAHFVGVSIDISDKKELEKEVIQAQKMEALGSIAGGIAHDLNNVLGAVLGYSEFVREDINNNKMPNPSHIENSINAVERAVGIVRQILSFSRKTNIKKVPVELKSITRDALNLIERTIPKSIEVKQDIQKENVSILADANNIHQVVMNLCTNAWHSMRETGGTLSVKLSVEELTKEDLKDLEVSVPGIYEALEIKDTGCGIRPKDLENIFNPFFTTKEDGEGTGLGLAVVNKIVNEHGGFITVDSVINKGTVFTVYFPITEQTSYYEKMDKDKEVSGGNETLLLVDDEVQLKEATTIMLERMGYKVISAENGAEGLEKFLEFKKEIDLIITDLAMPKMTGYELAQKIRQEKEDMPMILCTGFSESLDNNFVPREFFNAFLNKPIRKVQIAEIIRKVLAGEFVNAEEYNN